jgi:hypothetical protein
MTRRRGTRPRGRLRGDRRATPGAAPRAVAVFSRDRSIIGLVDRALGNGWRRDLCPEPGHARNLLVKAGVKVVVIDERAIEEGTRGWLLDGVHKLAPDALVAYIAASHSPELERWARSRNVSYYDAQPIEPERILRILRSFIGAARR